MNFCTKGLCKSVQILNGKVAEDGSNAENLLTETLTSSATKCGFMCARFIRPPVTIRFDFLSPVNISHIVINTRIGQQQSTAFKIETTVNCDQDSSSKEHVDLIAKEFCQGPPFPDEIVFKNPRFLLQRRYCSLPLGMFEKHRNFPNALPLRHPNAQSCERVFSMFLTIERAVSPSRIPVLKSVEIWGQPSKWTSFKQVSEILEIWKSFLPINNRVNELENDCGEPKAKILKEMDESNCNAVIPDEFLDPVTNEIFCLPMRLPSGIALDMSTLEKYWKEEERWGRAKNDPFTGIPFSDTLYPVPDDGLKGRVDQYLTSNSTSLNSSVPRTVGKLFRNRKSNIHPSIIVSPSRESSESQNSTECLNISENVSNSMELSRDELMEAELDRILGRTSNRCSSSSTIKSACCWKCKKQENDSKGSTFWYGSSCSHLVVCRDCLLGKWNNENELKCEVCNRHLAKSNWIRSFI